MPGIRIDGNSIGLAQAGRIHASEHISFFVYLIAYLSGLKI